MSEQVNHPSHYNTSVGDEVKPALKALSGITDEDLQNLECIQAMHKYFGATAVYWFAVLSAFKYLWRAGNKGDKRQDYDKAKWYLQYADSMDESLFSKAKKAEKLIP